MMPCLFFLLILAAAAAAAAATTHGGFVGAPSPQPPLRPASNGHTCTVLPLGNDQDDTAQIRAAFAACNHGGTVVFPAGQTYYIATALHVDLTDVTIDWAGTWLFSADLAYWREHAFPIAFQNHRAGFVVSGARIALRGHGSGVVNGSGNSWYTAEEGETQPGRPMPFVWWNVSDVSVEHFSVVQSPLWAINIMNGTNVWFDDIYVNSTALSAPYGENWVQNTDGFDTMDCVNITLTNFVYQGGDDAIAVKPRSYNIYVQNVTVHGGNGIAIGSLGQYLEDSSVANVTIKDANIITNNDDMKQGAYIKTWVGELVYQDAYESGYQARGGGWGNVTNIVFENFYIEAAGYAATITQDSGNNGSSTKGTSNMLISDITFSNFTGYLTASTSTNRTTSVSCSTREPCYGIVFEDFALEPRYGAGYEVGALGTCTYMADGGVEGMTGSGC